MGSDAASCTQADPCSIVHAIAVITPTRDIVKLAAGTYSASLTIENKTVRVIGPGATLSAPSLAPFQVRTNGSLEVVGLTIQQLLDNNEAAIRCEGTNTFVALDQVSVDAKSFALLANPCSSISVSRSHLLVHDVGGFPVFGNGTITVDRTLIDGAGAVVATGTGSSVHVSNSVVAVSNGTDGPFGYSFLGAPLGTVFVSFSTVLSATPVKCATSVACTGSTQGLCIDNSIIASSAQPPPAEMVAGPGCIVNYAVVFPQTNMLMGANNKLGTNPQLLDPINGDFHLKPGSPAIDAADPASGNPIDFDGVPRPQGAGRDIGAYEFKP